jgi:hypothetical protein
VPRQSILCGRFEASRKQFFSGEAILKLSLWFYGGLWRREWDSNPRYLAVNTLSKRAPSATRPSLRARNEFQNIIFNHELAGCFTGADRQCETMTDDTF